jgi:hypothetical protein
MNLIWERTRARFGALSPWLPRLMALAVALPSVVVLYYIFWARLSYPLDLEWMESGVLVTAKRAMDGAPLYASPSVDFASFCYPPLYPLILGWLGRIFGLSYTLGRALSVLAFTTTLSLMVHAAWRATKDAAPALCGPGVSWHRRPTLDAAPMAAVSIAAVAVAYGWTGAWYDLVRIDMVFLALSVGGLYALGAGHRSVRGVIVAGGLLGLAYFAKQTAVFFIVAAGLFQLLVRARLLPVLVVTVGVVAGLGTLAFDRATDGWFWFYIYELHQSHQTDAAFVWSKAPLHLWLHARWLYVGCGAAVVLWGFAAVVRRRLAPHAPLWLLGAVAGVAAATVGRSTQWAFDNAYIPGVVLPAIFCAVAAAEARGLLALGEGSAKGATGWRARVLARQPLLAALVWVPGAFVGIGVLSVGTPEVRRWVPDGKQRSEAQRFLVRLKQLGREGEVFVPYHPYYNVLAGGRGHGHVMNVNDVGWTRSGVTGGLWGDGSKRRARVLAARRSLLRSIRASLRSDRFVAVIHDRNVVQRWIPQGQRAVLRPHGAYLAQIPGLTTYFRPEVDLAWLRAAPRTLSGNPSAPRFVWRRPRPARPPAGSRVVFDFEAHGLDGWKREGTAFGRDAVVGPLWDPLRRRAQGLVGGAGGRRWLSSFHGGDVATGKVTSPSFRLDRPVLRLRVGGGSDRTRLGVHLRVDGQVVRSATGHNSEQFRPVIWDVRPWQGRDAVLEVVDATSGPWGHLQLDEVWLGP